MDFTNYDLYFPNLGLGIEHLQNSISVFGIRVAFYGIIISFGMLLGTIVAHQDYVRRGGKSDDILDFGLYAIFLSVLGARLYYVAFRWDYYSRNLAEIPNIRKGGLAIYGGILTAFIFGYIFTRKRKLSYLNIMDSGVIGLALGQAIGRWGNFFNAEAFGCYTESLFAMRIRLALVTSNMLNDNVLNHLVSVGGKDYIQVHPTFFYESAWNFLVFLVLSYVSRKKKFLGQTCFLYLTLYGFGRFFIEQLRVDSLLLWGTRIAVSQALSAILFVLGIIVLAHLSRTASSRLSSNTSDEEK